MRGWAGCRERCKVKGEACNRLSVNKNKKIAWSRSLGHAGFEMHGKGETLSFTESTPHEETGVAADVNAMRI